MGNKKYVGSIALTVALFLTAAVLLFLGFGIWITTRAAYGMVFMMVALGCCILAVICICRFREGWQIYDTDRIRRKIRKIAFTEKETGLTAETRGNFLLSHGFQKQDPSAFGKPALSFGMMEKNPQDSHMIRMINAPSFSNFQEEIAHIGKEWYQTAFVFLHDDSPEERERYRTYITEYMCDREIHPFRRLPFVCPILIADGKAYFLNLHLLLNPYQICLDFGTVILDAASGKN